MNPADAPIRIAYQLTEKDLREALAKHGGKGAKVLPVFGACFVDMGVVSTALSPKDYVTTVPAILLGLFWFGLSRLQARLAYKRGGAMTQDRVEAELSYAGFESVTSTSSGKSSWKAFTRYSESKNLFQLYRSNAFFNIVPKRAFAAGGEEAFRSLLERHLGEATKAYRRKIKPRTWVWIVVVIVAIILLVMSNVMIRKRERVVPGENESVGRYQPRSGYVWILERAEVG